MSRVGFTSSKLWTDAFQPHGDDSDSARATLAAAFHQFRSAVEPVAADIALSVPGYTDHGIMHCDSLWETASQLLPHDYPMNPAEAFVLGGAFLVHDLGMGLSAHSGGLRGILATTPWLDFLYANTEDAESLQAIALADVAADPTWDGLTSNVIKALLTKYLRNTHAEQAERVMTDHWQLSNDQPFYLLSDPTLRRFYGNSIGRIARSHWIDVAELPEYLPATLGPAPGMPATWTVNPIKLASVLRLADAINIDARRAHPLHTPHRNPQGDSKEHWKFQERFMLPQVKDRRVVFTSGESFPVADIESWWLAYDMVRAVDSELRRVDNLCGDLGLPRLAAHAAAGAESPLRFAQFVPTEGWSPIDARPFIGDQNLVMRQLGGESLYGSHRKQEIAFRELLANALDASRAMEAAFPSVEMKAVRINLQRDEEADYVVIRDFGVGMTAETVAQRLCNFGTSGWRNIDTQKSLPGVLSSGYKPTGQFGIGFFAAFMAAQDVTVVTRHVEQAKSDTSVLKFTNGLFERPILRQASREEAMLEPGTQVTLKLNHRIDDESGLLGSTHPSYDTDSSGFAGYVGEAALTSNVPIEVIGLGNQQAVVRAVVANQWLTLESGELFDALNSRFDRDNVEYDKLRSHFKQYATNVLGPDGSVRGRMCLDPDHKYDASSSWVRRRGSYCGGLIAERSSAIFFLGVLEGSPRNAVRDSVVIDIPTENLRRWFSSQRDQLVEIVEDPAQLMWLAEMSVEMSVETGTLPIALTSTGYASRDDVMAFASELPEVHIYEGVPREYDFDGRLLRLVSSSDAQDLFLLPEGSFAVGEPYRIEAAYRTPEDVASPAGDNVGPVRYWERIHASLLAEVARSIAASWSLPLGAVVAAMTYSDIDYNGLDERQEVERLGGGTIKVGSWCINRGQAEIAATAWSIG